MILLFTLFNALFTMFGLADLKQTGLFYLPDTTVK